MPMDLNTGIVVGRIQGFKVYDDAQYPWAWVRLGIAKIPYIDKDGETAYIDSHTLFLNFSVPQKKLDLMDNLRKGSWMAVWETIFDTYIKNKKPIYKLKCNVLKFMINSNTMKPQNCSIICGMVTDQSSDGSLYRIGMSYLNPIEKDPRKKWQMRHVKVYAPYLTLDIGSRYLIIGKIAGQDVNGIDGVILVAESANRG